MIATPRHLARAILLSIAMAPFARAADSPPKPAPFLRVSVASLDILNQTAADLAIPMPSDLRSVIEAKMPFIGTGGIDPSKPGGIIGFAGDDLSINTMEALAFPLIAGKASLDDLAAAGGEPVQGNPETLRFRNALSLKRAGDYLLLYMGDPTLLQPIPDNPFGSDYQTPGTLAYLEINAATARVSAPHHFEAFFNSLRTNGNKLPNPVAERERLATQDFLANLAAKINLLTLDVRREKDDFLLTSKISPTFAAGTRHFRKPILPADSILTMHMVFPDSKLGDWLLQKLAAIPTEMLPVTPPKITPEQLPVERGAMHDLAQLFAAADAISLAIENHNGKPVLTAAIQFGAALDIPTQFRKAWHDLEFLEGSVKITDAAIFKTIPTSDGSSLLRAELPAQHTVLFIAQTGHLAVFTLSTEAAPTPTPVTLSTTDEISDLLSAHLDLPALLASGKKEDEVWKRFSPDQQQHLAASFAGKSVDAKLTTDAPANALRLDLRIPANLIRAMPLILAATNNLHAHPPQPVPSHNPGNP